MDIYFYLLGGRISLDNTNTKNDILEYDPETKKWTQIGSLREARAAHAVSVLNFTDYAEWCD